MKNFFKKASFFFSGVVLASILSIPISLYSSDFFVDLIERANTLTQDQTLGPGTHLLLPQENDAVTPTLAFGDANSGMYEAADNSLAIGTAGVKILAVYSNGIEMFATNAPAVVNQTPSATNPVLNPNKNDVNSGMGQAAIDQLSFIAGGVEGHRITEAAGAITHNLTGNVGIGTASPDDKLQVVGDATIGLENGDYDGTNVLSDVLNALSPTESTVGDFAPIGTFRLRRAGTSGTKWGHSVDFALGGYDNNILSHSQLDIKLTEGNTATPDMTVISFLSNGNIYTYGTITLDDATNTTDGGITFDRTNEDLSIGDGSASQIVHMGAWKTWTPTFAGFSADPGSVTARYTIIGKTVIAHLVTGNGTSNAITFTVTLPVAAANTAKQHGSVQATDNGSLNSAAGLIVTNVNSTTADIYLDFSQATWTAAGPKKANFVFTYETI